MSKLKNIVAYAGVICIMLLGLSPSIQAQALVGGEISYRCIGNDYYEVNLVIRKDCNEDGIAIFDNSAAVGIFDIFGALILGLGEKGVAHLPLVSQMNVQDDIVFDCESPLESICIEEGIYRDTVLLPWNKIGYIISYQRCCRDSEILNIINPGTTGATYSSLLNYIASGECNSQPVFNGWASAEVCVDTDFTFDHSATDQDGDQLAYRLCPPSKGASVSNPRPDPPANPPYQDIDWANGYDLNVMLGAGNSISINPNTGILTVDGNLFGTYLVGICVDEYRNGSLLSTVKRDFQLTVTSCIDPLTADFEVENIDCDGDNAVNFINNSIGADSYTWYFDYPNTDPAFISTDTNPSFTYPASGTYTVRLESTRDEDGCTTFSEQTITIKSTQISADFEVSYADCNGGEQITLIDQSTVLTGGIEASDWQWTVIVAGDTLSYTGDTVTINVPRDEMVEITLVVSSADGCSAEITDAFLNNFGNDLIINPTIDNCEEDILLTLTDEASALGGIGIVSQTWNVDGAISNGNSVSFIVDEDGVIVNYVIEFENGCIQEFNGFYKQEDFNPEVDFLAELIECVDDSATVMFTGLHSDSIAILTESWTINGLEYTDNPLTIVLSTIDIIDIEYMVVYENGCEQSISRSSTLLPELSIDNDQMGCPDVDSLLVTFEPTFSGGLIDVTPIQYDWIYDLGLGQMTYSGRELILMIQQGILANLSLTVLLEGGCTISADDEFMLGQDMSVLDIDENLNCDDPLNPVVRLSDLTVLPPGVTVESYSWTVNGLVFTSSSIEFIIDSLGSDVHLLVTYSNGCEAEYNKFFEPTLIVEVDIEVNSIDSCTGMIDLYVANPDSLLNYEWALNSSFDNIIGTGINLVYDLPEFYDGFVYVQATAEGDRCIYGLDSIAVADEAINISFDDDFRICAGDTLEYVVTNNNPDHILTLEWKGGSELISGGDTTVVVIGVPSGQEEEFFLVLCSSNQYGCTAVDTINFMIGQNEDLDPFSFEIDSCGSLTVNFMANNQFEGFPHWDFGDGNTSNELNPSNTYPSHGTYVVTLSDSSSVCPQNSVMDTIEVPEALELNIEADTIYFEPGDTLIINAITNGDPSTIQWCNEDGETIFTGNPLTYVPLDSCVVLTAKISDENGCEDSDMVVLKEDDECDDFEIDGPEVVCADETFELNLDTECELGEYTYLWAPAECIISGGNTPNPTVSTTVSKTFEVLIMNEATGLDTILSIFVEVSMPEISISTMNGEDFICLGETGTLLVVPADPNCEYTWSTGETGTQIEVDPETDMTYTVTCVDIYGCEVSAEFTLMVTQPTCNQEDVFVPNAFSPNGDNVNDILYVRSKFIESMDFQIMDRWGNEVFRSTDQATGWDGTYKGEALAPDAFAYGLRATCINGEEYVTSGNVSIIK